jgi:hypothetical protein
MSRLRVYARNRYWLCLPAVNFGSSFVCFGYFISFKSRPVCPLGWVPAV